MSLRWLLSRTFALLLPLTVTATIYLYLYPVFNGCAFPLPQSVSQASEKQLYHNSVINTLFQHLGVSPSDSNSQPAIFRLLVLADPQLEGDTSLPFPEYELYPRMQTHWCAIQEAIGNASTSPLLNEDVLSNITTGLRTLATEDIPRAFRSGLKRIDLFGNDYYLAHIYRTLFWWTRPTHTTVLGDLVGSQWISDDEFAWRGHRYWNRVFRGGERVDDNITRTGAAGWSQGEGSNAPPLEPLGADRAWARRVINVAGNHDIGYAGDISEARMERFERVFGRANWDVRFEHPPISSASAGDQVVTPTLHLINLNSLMFDTPALSAEVQSHTYSYLNDLIADRLSPVEDRSAFTLLLTHLPLHKEDGVCTDGPYFSFRDSDDQDGPDGVPRWLDGGLKEQNHLSDSLSANGVLQGIFGLSGDKNALAGGQGRNGLILTGHDHPGCDAIHFVNRTETTNDDGESRAWKWDVKRFDESQHTDDPSIREVTLRSMMGEFGGNAGLLSAWFDEVAGEWSYEITMCPAGVQHIWWAVHILVLVTLGVALLWFLSGDAQAKTAVRKVQPEHKTQNGRKK
ncbi:hypothetical protein PEX1_093250 [Penicillium expansum]|uniref:Calcineurin-like phosphoesterase domain-containing protein n=1 Tax=Penicillium expansum TaxID=27334 RepID=A0A0A2I9D0_PENEN|nr:hypothetical protein PEX2_106340 [Penicillium expansum]KGO39038.1 hypothetical protein PEX1_093250 [Penicillium expansum]KGO49612.1 hypothetical protein PEX2_106340 [Penicillium expansum]